MKVRNEQMDAFAQAAELAFETQMMEILRQRHAGAIDGFSPDLLRHRVRAALAKGRSQGFSWQSALAGFVVMMFEVGPTFDQHPAFKRALRIRLPDENARIRAIYDNLTDEDWDDACQSSGASGWDTLDARSN